MGAGEEGDGARDARGARRAAAEKAFAAAVVLFVLAPFALGDYAGSPLGFFPWFLLFLVHETGHIIAGGLLSLALRVSHGSLADNSLARFALALAGTAAQLGLPGAIAAYYAFGYRRRALAFAFASLLAFSLVYTGQYVADAGTLSMKTVTLGGLRPASDNPQSHDFHYLLGKLGLVGFAPLLGGFLEALGLALALPLAASAAIATAVDRGRKDEPVSAILLAGTSLSLPFVAAVSPALTVFLVPVILVTAWKSWSGLKALLEEYRKQSDAQD